MVEAPDAPAARRPRPDPFGGYLPLDYRSYGLGRTLTHAKRSLLWIPADPTYPKWDGRLGQLTIKVQAAAGWSCECEVDSYVLAPDSREPGDEGPAFWLMNVTDPDAEEPYRLVMGDRVERCGCKAGKCRLDCKHTAAIAKLIDEGNIDPVTQRVIL